MLRNAAPPLVALPRAAIYALRRAGVDLDAHAQRQGAASARARMTPEVASKVVGAALAEIGDDSFALQAGAHIRIELFEVLGHAVIAAPTFGAAALRLARYLPVLAGGSFAARCLPTGDLALRRSSPPALDPRVDRAHMDFELASIVEIGRRLTGTALAPSTLALRGRPPAHAAAYARWLGVSPSFEAPYDELVIGRDDLGRALRSGDTSRAAALASRAEALVVEYTSPVTHTAARVRAAVGRLLQVGRANLDEVARSLAIPTRSLQRELAAERTSFVAILDDVRHRVACEELVARDVELPELASRIGLSSTAALHRAFQRWEGTTPLSYRDRARGRPAIGGDSSSSA